jgi:CubicO group peptidase (beta-lactamase class C family)
LTYLANADYLLATFAKSALLAHAKFYPYTEFKGLDGETVMSSGEFVEKLEDFVAEAMLRDHVPGLSLAVVKDEKVIYARGFGARRLKDNAPATPDTLYGVGSCTKSFTALAIMQLVQQGKLNLKDSVKKHLPEFKVGKDENPITIHNLLTHSSGIPDLSGADVEILRHLGVDEKWVPFSSFEDLILHVNGAKDEVAAEPGSRFFYLNEGYELLGMIVERVSQMRYEYYVRDKILKPLKMNRSTFLKEEFEKDQDVMTPYFAEKKDGILLATPTVHPISRLSYADGGLMSSVMELTNYLIANMNHGVLGEVKLLDSVLMQEMYKPHMQANWSSLFGKPWYGYGWHMEDDFFGHMLIGHGGSTGVSSANLSFLPDLNMGIVYACNVGGGEVVPLVPSVVLALLMGKDPFKEIPVFEIEKKMTMLVGEYAGYKGIVKISVVRRGGLLFIESKEKLAEQSLALIPESNKLESLKFYVPMTGARMAAEFIVEASGKVDLYIERNRFHKIK